MKKLWLALALILSCMALLPTEAQATAWEAKTMRASLSAREVERPLILGKGWLELSLEAQVKSTDQYWGPQGEKLEWDYAEWLYTKETVRVRYGVLRRGELSWEVPVHYLRLQNENLGTNTKGLYWGDPRFSFTFEPFRTQVPLTSVVVKAEMKAPMGNESPGSYIAGPSTFQRFITTTGTPDLTLSARGKRQFGVFATEAGIGYMYRFSGIAQYLLETTNNQLNGRLKPGNQVLMDASGTVQFGPVAIQGGLWYRRWGTVDAGTTSSGLLPNGNLEPIVGSDGSSFGLDVTAIGHVIRGIDVVAAANIPLTGEDLMFFPIEDLHPTRGVTYTARLEFRF